MNYAAGKAKALVAIVTGVLLYLASAFYVHRYYEMPWSDLLPVLLVVGLGFSGVAWLLAGKPPAQNGKSFQTIELLFLLILIGWVALYITYGGDWIDRLLPRSWIEDDRLHSWVVMGRKLLVFAALPFLLYRAIGFRFNDFGGSPRRLKLLSIRGITLVLAFAVLSCLYQYYFSRAGQEVRAHPLSASQWWLGGSLGFIWLIFEAGVVEEFFFRVLLQSRLAAWTGSPTAAIVITSLIFGLTHAPGLYFRGAESEGVEIAYSFGFFAAYTILFMSVAGIFLSVLWYRTRNFWLVAIIHAFVDWMPFLHGFCKTWNIH